MDDLVGQTARVTARVHGTSLGEVMLSVPDRQGCEMFYARAEKPEDDFPVGTIVFISQHAGGRTLIVSDFV